MLAKLKSKYQLILKITASCFIFILAVFLFAPFVAHAQTIAANLTTVGAQTGLSVNDPRIIVGNIIRVALGLLGAVAISIILYAGFLYMTAGGEVAKIEKAKKWLINAFIGLVIILGAYSIASYIISSLTKAMNEGGVNIAGLGPTNSSLSGGAFGSIIQSQYPMPEQIGVPRNTMILVTFRLPIVPASVVTPPAAAAYPCPAGLSANKICGTPNTANFKVARCTSATLRECADIAADASLVPGYIMLSEDHRTVIFNPYGQSTTENLGSADEDWFYVVKLTSGIQKEGGNGMSIFSLAHPDHKWRFSTSTVLDNTPPQVDSVIPIKDANNVDLNSIVVVNFNEPVIPPLNQTQACVGDSRQNEIQVINEATLPGCMFAHVPGNLRVGINGYRSVKFISSTKCAGVATNSCGQPVYCLPSNSAISGKVLAAGIIEGCFGDIGTGITDMGGNSLDGNGNGTCEGSGAGPALDDVDWTFHTGEHVDLEPPHVVSLSPENKTGSVAPNAPLTATMNKNMDPETVNTEVELVGAEFTSWFNPNMGRTAAGVTDMKQISILHGDLMVAPVGGSAPMFTPIIHPTVQDTNQNCFSPSRDAGACNGLTTGGSCCPDLAGGPALIPHADTANCGLPRGE